MGEEVGKEGAANIDEAVCLFFTLHTPYLPYPTLSCPVHLETGCPTQTSRDSLYERDTDTADDVDQQCPH